MLVIPLIELVTVMNVHQTTIERRLIQKVQRLGEEKGITGEMREDRHRNLEIPPSDH